MRVLIITDSLGCPRKEIDVKKTWTEMLLEKWSTCGVVFYTQCVHGLSIKKIDIEYIKELSPDILILQVGIVDACRRAQTKIEFHVFSRIPLISKIVRSFCSRHHFVLTRIRNIHDCSPSGFEERLRTINNIHGKLFFIAIAPPGEGLIKKVYQIQKDVDTYNKIAKQIIPNSQWIDPYLDAGTNELLLQDGHHLTEVGNRRVYKCINEIIEREVNKKT